MERATISSADGRTAATFVPAANLLCASLTHDGAELLDHGHGVEAYAERGKTMGIPLLYPWANRLSRPGYTVADRTVTLPDAAGTAYPVDPAGLPIHGAMPGALRWAVEEAGDGWLAATLRWTAPELLALFPFRHRVTVRASVEAGALTLATEVHADGGDPVPVSFGYHPYLTLPGSSRADWRVTLGAGEHLTLDERMIPTGERSPLSAAERELVLGETSFDDGFTGLAAPARFSVSDPRRTLAVTFQAGYDWAQVYAPPGHDYICFEPMTAPTDALRSGVGLTVLAPGETYQARVTFAVTA